MMYQADTNQTAVRQLSLLTDTGDLNKALVDICGRLVKIGDTLHGSEPRDAGLDKGAPEPVPTVRRNLDNAQRSLSRINDELTRIENKL
jgi:hypothetical protein